jgi:acetyl-CoA acetyltransferase
MNAARRAAIVGVGATPYLRRGESLPRTEMDLVCEALRLALDDAGLATNDVDGVVTFAGTLDVGLFAETVGLEDLRYAAVPMGGGSGSVGSVVLAESAIAAGLCDVVVVLKALQSVRRLGAVYAEKSDAAGDFMWPFGAVAPGHFFSLMTQRHMFKYGTTRRHLAEVCMTQRRHAIGRPHAAFQEPLTLDEYFGARMISDPLCIHDYTVESDGAVALIVAPTDRIPDLRSTPVAISASVMGGDGAWGRGYIGQNMPDELYTTAGHTRLAERLYGQAGIQPQDIDVALLYDHFSPLVLMQLEDWGFCPVGTSGPFVMEGHTAWPDGNIPVNTHGGHLSEAYLVGMTHLVEAVEQIRGTAVKQVAGAELALVTGGPSVLPGSAVVLGRDL